MKKNIALFALVMLLILTVILSGCNQQGNVNGSSVSESDSSVSESGSRSAKTPSDLMGNPSKIHIVLDSKEKIIEANTEEYNAVLDLLTGRFPADQLKTAQQAIDWADESGWNWNVMCEQFDFVQLSYDAPQTVELGFKLDEDTDKTITFEELIFPLTVHEGYVCIDSEQTGKRCYGPLDKESAKELREYGNEEEPISSAGDPWESFVSEMEKQGVTYDSLHTLENMGLLREEIMLMSASEIEAEIERIQGVIKQNKIKLLAQMLGDPEMVKAEEQFVFSGSGLTQRLHLIEQSLQDIQANEWAGFTGYVAGNTVPIAYELAFKPDGEVTLMTYNDYLGLKEYIVTDIYEHKLFYHFTDNKELYFSIPKAVNTFAEKTSIEGYIAGGNLEGIGLQNPLTAQQAVDKAAETRAALAALDARDGLHIDIYGAVVPDTITVNAPADPAKVVGAVRIHNAEFYKVGFFQSSDELNNADSVPSEVYYVSVDGDTVFMESMVAGELIPIGYKEIEHFKP